MLMHRTLGRLIAHRNKPAYKTVYRNKPNVHEPTDNMSIRLKVLHRKMTNADPVPNDVFPNALRLLTRSRRQSLKPTTA